MANTDSCWTSSMLASALYTNDCHGNAAQVENPLQTLGANTIDLNIKYVYMYGTQQIIW